MLDKQFKKVPPPVAVVLVVRCAWKKKKSRNSSKAECAVSYDECMLNITDHMTDATTKQLQLASPHLALVT